MRGFQFSARLFLAVAFVGGLAGCMDASLVDSGSAPASIMIQAVPPTVRDLGLRVSGPGMPSVAKGIPIGTDALVLEVPVGPARWFELRARLNQVGSSQLNESVWYGGRRQAPVPPSGAFIPLKLSLRSTLLVPDTVGTGRLLEVPELVGTDAAIDAASTWDTSIPAVSDIAVGPRGNLYAVADMQGTGALFDAPSTTAFGSAPLSSDAVFDRLAVDLENPRVYAYSAATDAIWAVQAGTGTAQELTQISSVLGNSRTTFGRVQALAVDPNGFLYVAQSHRIGKFNPATEALVAGYDATPLNIADIMIRDDGLYVLVNSERISGGNPINVATRPSVLRVLPDMNSVAESFGSTVSPSAGVRGSFFGPLRFIAENNPDIAVADSDGTVARLVQFRNLDGDGWREYGQLVDDPGSPLPGEMEFASYQWD